MSFLINPSRFAAAIGNTAFYQTTPNVVSYSANSTASKGSILNALTAISFEQIDMAVGEVNPFNYMIRVVTINPADEKIASIVATSSVVSTDNGARVYTFPFSSVVEIPAGAVFAIILVRLGGNNFTISKASSVSAASPNDGRISYYGAVRYASNNPQVGDSPLFNKTTVCHCEFDYTY